ncbi:MAG: tandem-95 repeat protein, partial [Coriobacteriia bacterium]|nr:tandem-95 repeat protein [Coriobacteriia bacterium]
MAHGARALIPQRYGTAEHLKRGLCLLLSLALVTLGVTFAPAPAVAMAPPVAFDDPEAMSKLLADDGASADQLGYSVAIDGDTAIVGAPKDGDMGPQSGSAYVFTRSGGTWTQQAKLTAADGASFQYFGTSVSLSGDTAMIGASGANTNRGCVYVFARAAGVWTEQVKLTAADGEAGDQFGAKVALSGGTAVVGAPYDDDKGLNSGAAYVFTGSGAIWTQQVKLTATDAVDESRFGSSAAIDGDTVVVGSYMDDYKGTDSGSVYVFTRFGTSWSQQAKLTAADGAASEFFGYSVAVSGDTALIGASRDGEKGTGAGAAYVFTRSGASWSQEAKLTAADGGANDYFGISVALAGGSAVIGSYFDDDKGSASGSAYVFTRAGTSWWQQAKLTAADGAATDYFGVSVALSGGTAVIGSYMDDDKGTDSGSAYIGGLPYTTRENTALSVPAPGVLGNDSDPLGEGLTAALAVDAAHGTVELAADGSFTYTPDAGYSGTDSFTYTASDQWLSSPPATVTITIEGVHDAPVALEDPEIAKVLASDGEANDYLGLSVAISGDTAVIGAHGDDDKAASAGAAYVYVREGGSWKQQAKLTASDGATDDLFGTAVAISGDTVVVGVSNDDDKGMDSGSAYVFTRSGTVWTQQAKLTASDGAFNDRFATAVAVSGDTILVGAPRDDHALGTDAGSVYVFTRSDGTWTEKQKVLPYYFEHNAQLGSAVALSGDLAVVGLPGAAYGAGFANAGRAYVLARVAGSFTYSDTVTARDYAAEARFGSVVAISGDTALVGSQLDYLRTGAAYVFTPTAPDFWEQEAKLTASDGVFDDYFGCSVAIDGNTAVIGAYGDADNGAFSGSAYVFTRSGTVWTEQAKLTAPDAGVNDAFGYTAAISGDTAVLGMYGDDDNGSTAGAAYLMGMPYTTAEDTPLSVSAPGVLKNDTDADGDDLAAVLVADALNGTVALAPDGSFTYTPDADFFGEDTFTYAAGDGALSSEPAAVTVTVTPADDAPVTVDDAFLVDEDAVLTEAAPGVLANDSDPDGDTLTATLVKNVSNGTLNLSTTGAFTYTPKADFTGTDTFTYTAGDGVLSSESATVTITVTSANDAPVLAWIGNKTVNEGSELRFTATATDVDVPADTLTFSLSGAPAGAAITAAGVFTWTPTEAQGPGSYTFDVQVSDGELTDSESITVSVMEVRTEPVLAPIGNKTIAEGSELTFTASATDADLPANTLTYSLSPGAPAGAAITSAGDFTWTPTEAQGYGMYMVTVTVSDGWGSDYETFIVTVTEVNVAPVLGPIGDKTVAAGSELAFTASATDADLPANTLTYSLGAGAPAGATITAGGAFSWTPTAGQTGPQDITVVVSDGTATDSEAITVTVTEMNVAPVLGAIGDKAVDELTELTFTASATDANLPAQPLTFSLGAGAPAGAAITAGGVFTWTPTEAQGPGSFDITITVSDGSLTDSETITVTVGEVNVAPVLAAIGLQTVTEGSELTFTASATDADLPANTLTYELTYGPEGASMTSAGVFTWTPTEAQGPGVYAANVKVSDGSTFDYETFNVMVDEVNVAPVLASIGDKSVEELSELAFTTTATDADLPANTLTFSLGEGAPAGAAITAGGGFTWTPTADQIGPHDITITVSDGSLTDSETIRVTVGEMNVAPVLASIGDMTVDERAQLTFTASATDANLPAQPLTFT